MAAAITGTKATDPLESSIPAPSSSAMTAAPAKTLCWSIVILVASVLTSYAKARAELVLERMPGGLLERGERIGLLAIGAITGLLGPVLWLLAVGTVVTVGQRFLYARREMARLDIADREAVRHPGA